MTCLRFVSLFCLLAAATAAEPGKFSVSGRIMLTPQMLDALNTKSMPQAKIILNAGEYEGLTRADGSFVIDGVQAGVYALEVVQPMFHWSDYKIDVAADTGAVRALEYKFPGAAKEQIMHPLRLTPLSPKNYFEKRPSVGIGSLLKNPMVLMMLFTGFIVVVMPKMMAGIDPEEMKKMQEQYSQQQQDPNQLMANLFGGGGSNDDDDEDD